MAPLPKRKHSTYRKGKRIASRKKNLPKTIICPNCHKPKLPHRTCQYCNK